MLDGFNRHYRLFRESQRRRQGPLRGGRLARPAARAGVRIEFYDQRVHEAASGCSRSSRSATLSMDSWQQVKLHYIGLLTDHHQPELAETFFNSVTTKLLHRSYFRNDFIFVRPAVSTEYIENDEPGALPTYRAYYPTRETLRDTLHAHRRTTSSCSASSRTWGATSTMCWRRCSASAAATVTLRANFQIQVLSSLFYRNKGAYLVGKIVNGFTEVPFALPILHGDAGPAGDRHRAVRRGRTADPVQLRARLLHGRHGDALRLRAVPAQPDAAQAAHRDLQRARPAEAGQEPVLPRLPRTTCAIPATASASRPASRAWSCWCSTCRRFPYVFKVIKDFYPPQKDTTREQIKGKYLLVKQHDRVGRMADTLEYSNVAFPRARFERRADRRAQALLPEPGRGRRRRAGASATSTSSGA